MRSAPACAAESSAPTLRALRAVLERRRRPGTNLWQVDGRPTSPAGSWKPALIAFRLRVVRGQPGASPDCRPPSRFPSAPDPAYHEVPDRAGKQSELVSMIQQAKSDVRQLAKGL